jgi:hypothetical protein
VFRVRWINFPPFHILDSKDQQDASFVLRQHSNPSLPLSIRKEHAAFNTQSERAAFGVRLIDDGEPSILSSHAPLFPLLQILSQNI